MQDRIRPDYEIVGRKRCVLADGRRGWTGVLRMAYAMDATVVGFRRDWWPVPDPYRTGTAGGKAERDYAKHITSDRIRELSDMGNE